MVSFDYAFFHIERALRMAGGDAKALGDMEISADGFWRSFAAIIFAFPAMFFNWGMDGREIISGGSSLSMVYIVAATGAVELLVWLLPILLLALILKPLGLESRFTHFIIARNWFSVPVAYLFAFLALPALLFHGFSLPLFLLLLVLSILIFLLVRITRTSLETSNGLAWALVIGEFFLMTAVMLTLYESLGFYDGLGVS